MSLALTTLAPPAWDQAVQANERALLFHTRAWLDMLAELYGLTWDPLGILQEGQLVGLLPLMRRRLGPFRLAGSPLMVAIASTPVLGPAAPPHLFPNLVPLLEEHLAANRIAHIELAFPVPIDARPWVAHGYQTETCATVVLPLAGRSPGDLWGGLDPACRRAVRKAQRSPLAVVEAVDDSFLPAYDALCREVYREEGRDPHLSPAFYRALWRRLANTGCLRVLLAKLDGVVVAGVWVLVYRGAACYLSGASAQSALGLRPNNLLQWRVIESLCLAGVSEYDLGGATVPGITRFKLSFGAECRPYTRFYRARTLPARVARRAYAAAITPWRRLRHRLAR